MYEGNLYMSNLFEYLGIPTGQMQAKSAPAAPVEMPIEPGQNSGLRARAARVDSWPARIQECSAHRRAR